MCFDQIPPNPPFCFFQILNTIKSLSQLQILKKDLFYVHGYFVHLYVH